MRKTLIMVGMILLAELSFGATILVPEDYSTIQDGIIAAVEGDTVLVADGTFTGMGNRNIDFLGKEITVKSVHGPEYTVIDCEGLNRGFIFIRLEGFYSRLEGFTITNGFENSDAGILCIFSSPTISNCSISGNTSYYGGSGINCSQSSSPVIMNCTISNNTNIYEGGAIYCSSSSPTISNCIITGNTISGSGGAIYSYYSSNPFVVNCTISGNNGDNGGGLYLVNDTYATLLNCIMWKDYPREITDYYEGAEIIYSDIQGGWSGEGNIDADPLFLKEEWKDYRICPGSPCIDTGHPALWDGDGTLSDMGANFFDQSKELVLYLSPEAKSVARGNSGNILYTVFNNHDRYVSFRGRVEIALPGGEPWVGNPLSGPYSFTIPPYSVIQWTGSYKVPDDWPLGSASVIAGIGAGGELYDLDRFGCNVTEPDK